MTVLMSPIAAMTITRHCRRLKLSHGVTPAISVMIILSITLVCAFVVSVFSFGVLAPNTEEVTLTTDRVVAGLTSNNLTKSATSSLLVILYNHGKSVNITSLELSQNGWNSSITVWSITDRAQVGNSFFSGSHNFLPGGKVTTFTLYPVKSPVLTITVDETYLLMIQLSNGQSVISYLVAQ